MTLRLVWLLVEINVTQNGAVELGGWSAPATFYILLN